jgi:RNA polymerase sigma factor (sigma-70 family)
LELDGELRILLAELRPAFGAILSRFGIPPQDAEDRVQDALLGYLAKHRKIRNPAAWLKGALRNECRMYWRSRGRSITVAVDQALLDIVADEAGPEQERSVLRRNLKRWISKLDWRCREILRLRYSLGYEPREVAEEMGYKPGSIDKITRRCLDALARKASALAARRQPSSRGPTTDPASASEPSSDPSEDPAEDPPP